MEIRLEITGDTLTAGISRMLAASADFTPAMQDIAGLMEFHTRERFEQGKSPAGVPWQPSDRALEDGGRTLVDTTALLSDMNGQFDAFSSTVGTNLIYAGVHQDGKTIRPKAAKALRTPFGPRGSVKMPKREFLGFSPVETDGIAEILTDFINGAWEGAAQ